MGSVAETGPSVVMSANALADVERVCEHIVILVDGRVRLTGPIEEILADHLFVSAPRGRAFGSEWRVVDVREAERQASWLLRRATERAAAIPSTNGTIARAATLEEVVLAYLRSAHADVRA